MIQHFRCTDTGAPVLTGQAGSLIALLDAVLVNGYNSGSVSSITRSGSTVTVSHTAHGFSTLYDPVVQISGADQTAYNGKHKITVVDANTYTYTIASTPATPATGTITAKQAACGWTASYSGTNRKAWISPAINRYVEILENSAATTCSIFAYSTMSASASGSDQLGGITISPKSVDSASTATHWIVHSVDNLIYLLISGTNASTTSLSSAAFYPHVFGEFSSTVSNDTFNFILSVGGNGFAVNSNLSSNSNCLLLRGIDQLTVNPGCSFKIDSALLGTGIGGTPCYRVPGTCYAYPDFETGSIVTINGELWQTNVKTKRGTLQGVHFSPQGLRGALGALKTIAFTDGYLAGKTVLIVPTETTATGFLLLEM